MFDRSPPGFWQKLHSHPTARHQPFRSSYRGIPIQQNAIDNISQDAVVVVLGFQLQNVEVSYSYDVTVSELGPISGGAHEIGLKFKIELATQVRKRKKERFIPCPTFAKD